MKSYQKSNLFAILVLLLFSVSFLTPFITPTPVSAYEPFAVLTPLGSQIQVYTNPAGCNADYGDTKILNSYTNLVDTPSFCIYISNPNNQTHSLVLDMFAEVTVTIPVYDPSIHGYVSQNKSPKTNDSRIILWTNTALFPGLSVKNTNRTTGEH